MVVCGPSRSFVARSDISRVENKIPFILSVFMNSISLHLKLINTSHRLYGDTGDPKYRFRGTWSCPSNRNESAPELNVNITHEMRKGR